LNRHPLVAAILLAGLFAGQPATPQSSDVTLGISETAARRISLALPDFAPASSSETRKAAGEITKTLRDDLAFSGYFDVVKPGLYSDIIGYSEKKVLYKDWLDIGAESVVLGKVLEEPGKISVEGRLYDNKQQQLVMGRRYRGEPDAARNIAHRLGNEIFKQFTGQPGYFLTRIAFVSQVGRGKEIFVMDYDGERIKRLTNNGSLNLNPSWSPDGKEIAFLSYRTGRPELVILSSGGELRKAFPQQKGQLNLAPEWSPDGKRIAFFREPGREFGNLRAAGRRRTAHPPDLQSRAGYLALLVSHGAGNRLRLRSQRHSPDLHHGRRGNQCAAAHLRGKLERPSGLVAQGGQDRLLLASGRPFRPVRPRSGLAKLHATDARTFQQRGPTLGAGRPPPGLFIRPQRQLRHLRDVFRRKRCPEDHPRRTQLQS
jgi:hypothetical protein